MMRWVFLFIGFGAGLGVGLLAGGRESVHADRPPGVAHSADDPGSPARKERATVSDAEHDEPFVMNRRPDFEIEKGHGLLGVRGVEEAYVDGIRLWGGTYVELEPGAYVVWWLAGMRRIQTRATVGQQDTKWVINASPRELTTEQWMEMHGLDKPANEGKISKIPVETE